MTNSKSTKRALVSSALAVFLCVAMLIGTTFAWFTDTATTGVNKIQAGTLDVRLEMYEGGSWVDAEGKTLNFIAADGNTNILWEPGCEYNLPKLRIVNNGNLALKYKVVISGIQGDAELIDAIDWTIAGVSLNTELHLGVGQQTDEFTITGKMDTTAGDDCQGKSIYGISVTVYATQDTVESDSNNNQYDNDATLPSVWDGTATTVVTKNTEDGKYHITNAEEFMWLMNDSQSGAASRYYNEKIVLDCDIDLGGATINGFGNEGCIFGGSFDGKNHTVSNFNIDRSDIEDYAGLFNYYSYGTLENLTVKNATVNGVCKVGALVGGVYDSATVKNCSVVDCTVVANRKAAGAIGYGQYATVENVSVKDTTLYVVNTAQYGKVVGYVNTELNVTGSVDENVTVFTGTAPTVVSTAAQLKTALTPHGQGSNLGTIILTNDINVSDWSAVGANYTSFVLDGNGHSISGLTDALIKAVGPSCEVVVKNLTLSNVAVSLDQATGGNNATTGALIREVNCEGGNINLTIDNCHIDGGSVYAYKYAGGFTGMIGGADTNNIVIKNSSIKNLSVSTYDSSAGGFVAHTHSKLTITDCSVLGTTSVKCAEDRQGADAKAGYLVGTVNRRTTTISGCNVENTATLVNNNAVAALYNGLVGRNYATLTVAD